MVIDRIINLLTSLRLTVVCLAFALVLVFVGTLAQVELGLYKAQNDFFRSFFVYWSPKGGNLKIPVLPGGYLVGTVLLANLIAAHIKRFEFSRKKIGIFMIHAGLILLLLGQLLTDLLSTESAMRLREGQTRNYSEADRHSELAIVDVTEADRDKVVAIDEQLLARKEPIPHEALPFTIEVKQYYANSELMNRPESATSPPPATEGIGTRIIARELPRVTVMDFRDVPTAIIELKKSGGSLGTWLVSGHLDRPQTVTVDDRIYQLTLRLKRFYKPFNITLLDFSHDKYLGTEIPKNFSSRIRLDRPETGENREVLIYMNNPLRYWGETYYQASFDPNDDKVTILQVVRNPSWLTPYFACVMVGAGLLTQFLMHLVGFARRRMKT